MAVPPLPPPCTQSHSLSPPHSHTPTSHHRGGTSHQEMDWVSSSCWWRLVQPQLPQEETGESASLPLRRTDVSSSSLSLPSSAFPSLALFPSPPSSLSPSPALSPVPSLFPPSSVSPSPSWQAPGNSSSKEQYQGGFINQSKVSILSCEVINLWCHHYIITLPASQYKYHYYDVTLWRHHDVKHDLQ